MTKTEMTEMTEMTEAEIEMDNKKYGYTYNLDDVINCHKKDTYADDVIRLKVYNARNNSRKLTEDNKILLARLNFLTRTSN